MHHMALVSQMAGDRFHLGAGMPRAVYEDIKV